MRAILVANPKGGCGKTTLATNLAGLLARRGGHVAMCDLDRQKSAMEWLALRPADLPAIDTIEGDRSDRPARGKGWLIFDSPAGMHGKTLAWALRPAHKVLVPIQPSLFDMAATRDFLAALAEEKQVRKHKTFVGIVGMRVDARTRAAATLHAFLQQFDLPVVTFLRDTVNYANAAFTGRTVFDLAPSLAARDIEDWQPVMTWLED